MFASHSRPDSIFNLQLSTNWEQSQINPATKWQQSFFAGVGPDGTKYKTAYKCEGEQLTISCASDQTIKVTPSLWSEKSRDHQLWMLSNLKHFCCRLSGRTLVVFRLRSATVMAPLIWASIACPRPAIVSWSESEFSFSYCHHIAIFSFQYCHHIAMFSLPCCHHTYHCHTPGSTEGVTLTIIGIGGNSWVLSVRGCPVPASAIYHCTMRPNLGCWRHWWEMGG